MLNLKKSLIQKDSSEFGQTLIETIIAIFILVSGIAAAVGLAIFALSKSQNITKQMVAVGLAREGVEAIKNMRDTNWLKQTVINTNCYNRVTGANDAKCYQNWQDEVFDIEPTSGNPATKNVILLLDHNPGDYWVLCDKTKYGLAFDSNISNANFEGYYTPRTSAGLPNCNSANISLDHTDPQSSDFARQITIIEDDGVLQYGNGANNPFNKNTGPRLQIISRVWWADKQCPRSNIWPGLGKCSVELQTYLTNWKNY